MNESMEILPLQDWGLNPGRTLVIAGPCSLESEEQIMETAMGLSKIGVDVLRAGIWKPRSRPGSFEGIGYEGLKWLVAAGKASGLPVCVEVAGSDHVEAALKAGVDIVWIGARTTVNPFLVQILADALKGSDIPVMVKNPVNPDLALWIGALERINKAGINKIAAIHRGFSSYEQSKYRNQPNWELPIALKRRFPTLPLICDPSHISGKAGGLFEVAQIAMDLRFDGLMIEAHRNPKVALSDAEQQITPAELGSLLDEIVIRNPSTDDVIALSLLEELRGRIDKVDAELLGILARRMEIAREIGHYKKEHHLTILQPERWDEIIATRTRLGVHKELSPEFILQIYEMIHQESIRHQTDVMHGKFKESENR